MIPEMFEWFGSYFFCHVFFWRGISNVRNSRSLYLMTAQKIKQHIKKILLSKT